MSDYICTVRSNYFHVKDPASFRDFTGRVHGSVDFISLWQAQDEEGVWVWLLRLHRRLEKCRGG